MGGWGCIFTGDKGKISVITFPLFDRLYEFTRPYKRLKMGFILLQQLSHILTQTENPYKFKGMLDSCYAIVQEQW